MSSTSSSTSSIQIPTAEAIFFAKSSHLRILDYIRQESLGGANHNILLQGPQGSGKSTLPIQYAAVHKLPLATIDFGLLSEPSQIIGRVEAKNGSTFYVPSLFTKAIQTPGCVLHLQEINRPESDRSLNALFSILDPSQRAMWVDELDSYLKVASGVTFFASMNKGYEFIGTMPLDKALEDRFQIKLELEYLPANVEENLLELRTGIPSTTAQTIVEVANKLRTNTQEPMEISTRTLLMIASMVKRRMLIAEAFFACLGTNEVIKERINANLHFAAAELEVMESAYKLFG
jgi:nitric oxide reductase NorQ protein